MSAPLPEPTIWKPSVTVAAVIERDGRFLLVEEETAEGLMLNQPAGHLDPGESLIEACVRETLEETAHGFTPTALLGTYLARSRSSRSGQSVSYLRFAFTGQLGAAVAGRELDRGIVRTLWLTAGEIRESRARHRSPLVLQCVEDYLAGVSYPLALIHTHASVTAAA
ncbi:MAG: NUDIX hydrolase [Burkholderiaceae bacterium]